MRKLLILTLALFLTSSADATGVLNVLLGAGTPVTFSITAGTIGSEIGYSNFGSIFGTLNSSVGLKSGITLVAVFDQNGTNGATLTLSGFGGDPGAGSLVAISANGHTYQESASNYSYDVTHGRATWQWPLASVFGFSNGSTYIGWIAKDTLAW